MLRHFRPLYKSDFEVTVEAASALGFAFCEYATSASKRPMDNSSDFFMTG
jgi:hypothetical protein